MAKSLGVVSKVVGQVFAVGQDGTRRVLVEGDRLFAGEQLETGAAGAVAVHLNNGAELTLGRDSSLELRPELLANQAGHVQGPETVAPSEADLSDVERLQKAIAAGADPSQEAEATAAGPSSAGAPGAVGGGHSFVLLTEVAGRVDPVIGFPTAGFNGIPEFTIPDAGDIRFDDDRRPVIDGPDGPDGPDDPDHPVTLHGLDVAGGELTLHEAALPQGSASNPGALTQGGTFTVSAPDGVFNLNVGGINVVTGGVVTGIGQSVTTALGNVLTITGYDPVTGTVSYSYTLVTAGGTHAQGEQLAVHVSDSNGSVASGTLDVHIIDDAPQAVDDSNPTVATEQQTTLTGNVLTNDVQGADRVPSGPITAGTFVGTYGTLVLAADGSYTYTLNTDDPDFINLHGGGSGVEHFTYTLTDADGDSSTATLVLNVTNLDDPVTLDGLDVKGGELTVHEKHLGDGSAPDVSALTQSGTFIVTAADGLQTLVVGGITLVNGGVVAGFPQSITTPLGNTLTVTGYNPATGVVSYSYTLTDNEAHPNADGANSVSESFTVVATDSDGSSASGSIDVNIVDDLPQANPDSKSVVHEGGVVTGNVLYNDVIGADGVPDGKAVVGVRAGSDTSNPVHGDVGNQIMGTYGYLILNADGSATYHANPNSVAGAGATDTFVYTIRDADGDESTTTVTINVLDSGLSVSGADRDVTVYEKALD
ncbi:retention module-containing protein, partial [Pseudomonas guariconensis]|uniref:retention module-containing protein n=1 Tax=Pseudomonas guariconensis TaxID=1288410 RepID=UPI0018A98D61